MNIKNIFFATLLLFSFSACRETYNEEHGHEEGMENHAHDEEGNHMNGDHMEQEEFKVGEDEMEMHEESDHHTHDDGTEHEDH